MCPSNRAPRLTRDTSTPRSLNQMLKRRALHCAGRGQSSPDKAGRKSEFCKASEQLYYPLVCNIFKCIILDRETAWQGWTSSSCSFLSVGWDIFCIRVDTRIACQIMYSLVSVTRSQLIALIHIPISLFPRCHAFAKAVWIWWRSNGMLPWQRAWWFTDNYFA